VNGENPSFDGENPSDEKPEEAIAELAKVVNTLQLTASKVLNAINHYEHDRWGDDNLKKPTSLPLRSDDQVRSSRKRRGSNNLMKGMNFNEGCTHAWTRGSTQGSAAPQFVARSLSA
jgi:hypothetical protein